MKKHQKNDIGGELEYKDNNLVGKNVMPDKM